MSIRSVRLALLCTWVVQKHVNMHRFLRMGVNMDMSVSHEGLTYGMDGYRGTSTKMSGARRCCGTSISRTNSQA